MLTLERKGVMRWCEAVGVVYPVLLSHALSP